MTRYARIAAAVVGAGALIILPAACSQDKSNSATCDKVEQAYSDASTDADLLSTELDQVASDAPDDVKSEIGDHDINQWVTDHCGSLDKVNSDIDHMTTQFDKELSNLGS